MSGDWVLERPMPNGGPVEWDGAIWVGAIDAGSLDHAPDSIGLGDWQGEQRARLVVRDGLAVRGFVTVPTSDGAVPTDELRAQVAGLAAGDEVVVPERLPRISVVLCTKDRAAMLAEALETIRALDYPDLEIVVVENAPSNDESRELLESLGDDRIVRVVEPVAGLARARNTGVRAATGEIVAFTDDDVLVDPAWLRCVAAGFAAGPAVGCVSGLVPTGEIRTPTQAFFDQRVTWSDTVRRRVFSLDAPPADMPLFPFQLGAYGTGANFAMRREAIFQLGGFDEALGVGTRTSGGEDLDMFVRVILAGWQLVVEPSAMVWHRHRADQAALEHQSKGYGRGLGAWLAKVSMSPTMAAMAARRGLVGLRRLRSLRGGTVSEKATSGDESGLGADYLAALGRLEVRSMLEGPGAYLRERRCGAKARPLAGPAAAAPSQG